MTDATTPLRYPCPLSTCAWFYEAGDPQPDGTRRHPGMSDVDQAIRDHAATHDSNEWLDELAAVRAAASAPPMPIQWCTHCVVDHKQAPDDAKPQLWPGVVLATTMTPNGPNISLFCEVRHHLQVGPPKLLLAPAGAVPNGLIQR